MPSPVQPRKVAKANAINVAAAAAAKAKKA